MTPHFGLPEFGFLLRGLQWTLLLTVLAFAGGGIMGLAAALARTCGNATLERATALYIGIFQGTPLLLQLFVVYYGLALAGLDLPAFAAVGLGFTLNASAFLGEIWRGSIQAIAPGQTEAGKALGLHYRARMRHIVLPQAFRISLPATIGYLVQLVKGTSLAAIVGFIELARAGQIVSNQTYEPLVVYAVVGFIYFCLCWPLSLWGGHMEARLAVARR